MLIEGSICEWPLPACALFPAEIWACSEINKYAKFMSTWRCVRKHIMNSKDPACMRFSGGMDYSQLYNDSAESRQNKPKRLRNQSSRIVVELSLLAWKVRFPGKQKLLRLDLSNNVIRLLIPSSAYLGLASIKQFSEFHPLWCCQIAMFPFSHNCTRIKFSLHQTERELILHETHVNTT